MGNIILTGDRPTGFLHLGHFVGSLKERVRIQEEMDYESMFIMVADAQALTDNADHPEKIRENILNVVLDYLSVGIDPKKATIFIQSQVEALTELTFYYANLVTVSRLGRNPTVKNEIQLRGFGSSIPVGFFTYPISQAADITAFKANIVPVGEDQLPMIEQTREIVRTFNRTYGEVLIEPEAVLPDSKEARRLPGTDGHAKMSKSLGNCIYLTDDTNTVTKKVMGMYTDPNHKRIEDPGNTKDNPVFIYLEALVSKEHFQKYLPDYKNLEELKAHYEKGGLGDVKIKKFLLAVIEEILTPIRKRRAYYEEHLEEVYHFLLEGSKKANAYAKETLNEVKHVMQIDYFGDKSFYETYFVKEDRKE